METEQQDLFQQADEKPQAASKPAVNNPLGPGPALFNDTATTEIFTRDQSP